MKINNLSCERSFVDLRKPFKTSIRTATVIEVINVTLTLEDGQKGLGSATSTWKLTGESLESIEATVMGPIQDTILYQEIKNLNRILVNLELSCAGNSSAKAAVDIALHDLYGKVFQLPLYSLLGGKKDLVQTDITVGLDQPEKMKEDALDCVEKGFHALKIKVGNNVEDDIQRIKHIKESIGSHVSLRLDANQGWSGKQAVEAINEIEKLDVTIEFFEQPVLKQHFNELKFVKEHVSTPIMADESVFSPYEAHQLIKYEAVDLLNIKLMKTGGIRRAVQIAETAEAAGISCMIGSMMESSISVTAAAHLAYAHPNIKFFDLDAPLWLKNEPINGGLQYDNSHIYLTDHPGLGIES